jgi:aspartyl-tRNA(Asn)/glutamyl-tRNA(Gln) amidotransferase subunit B
MEEDAGKSIHDLDPFHTLIDLNRAGVPLVEVVSEPDVRSSDEAYQYINEVRKLVRYLDICDGNMEEGSLRCDANISVMLKGATEFGTKVEVKNMNSTRNVKRAIEFEIDRQIELLEEGGTVVHETRSFNAANNTTISMRHKEEANDYRYFPEPDLQAVIVTEEYIAQVKSQLPPLPKELYSKFTTEYGLSDYDTNILIDEKGIALYYNELCSHTKNFKSAANFVNGSVKSYLNENAVSISDFSISTEQLATLISIVDDERISNSVATSKVFPAMLSSNKTAEEIATENNWVQESDSDALGEYITQAIAKYPEKVAQYKEGKKGLIGLFMGEVMKLSKGQADPKLANQLLKTELEK